jgi:tRNA(adenine34) deaminase
MSLIDEFFMRKALDEARKAAEVGEIPVGAVITFGDQLIAKGYNQTVTLNDPTAHAEMIAITAATQAVGSRYLQECTLYVTLEPCVMCAGATFWSMLGRIVYGATDLKNGCSRTGAVLYHPRSRIESGVLAEECASLLKEFFKKLRK